MRKITTVNERCRRQSGDQCWIVEGIPVRRCSAGIERLLRISKLHQCVPSLQICRAGHVEWTRSDPEPEVHPLWGQRNARTHPNQAQFPATVECFNSFHVDCYIADTAFCDADNNIIASFILPVHR